MLISILTAVSSLTVVFIPTVVYILTVVSSLSDYSPHTIHTVIFISAYPAVRVKFYAYVNMIGRNDLITNKLFWKGKQSASLQLREGKNNANDSLAKGSTKRSRAKPFNDDWAVPAYITAVTAEVPLVFSPK